MEENSKAIVPAIVRPIATPAHIAEAHAEVTELITKALKDGEDYGIIPGTKRPTLLKPGAERLTIAFGAHAEFEILEQEIDHDRPNAYLKRSWRWGEKRGEKIWTEEPGTSQGIYRYVVRCSLVRPGGAVVGQGMGSCSSMESRYIDRPRDVENTILKMAKKRAHVDAVLSMAGLSDRFTQDLEDLPREVDYVPPAEAPSNPGSRAPKQARGDDPGSSGPPPTDEPKDEPKRLSTRAQQRMFFAVTKSLGWDEGFAQQWLMDHADGVQHTAEVEVDRMSKLLDELQALREAAGP